VAEIILALNADKERLISGHRIVWQAPILRHFTIRMEPLAD
jgi:hypothetical protein